MGVYALQNLRRVSQYLRSLPGVKPRLITDRGEAVAETVGRDGECLVCRTMLFLCQFSSIFLSISEWLFLVLSFTEQICPLPILFVFPLRWLDRQSKSATSRSQRRKGVC